MAKKITNLAEVKVYINGKEQAVRDLEKLTAKADELKTKIDGLKEQERELGKDPMKSAEYDKVRKDRINAEAEQKKLKKLINETKKFADDIEKDLDNLSGVSLARMKTIERSLTAIRQRLDPNEDKDGDFLAFLNEKLKLVADEIKNRKGDLLEFKDIMDDLTTIDDTSLAKVEQRLRSLIASTDKDDVDRLKQLNDELNNVVGEKNRRITERGEAIMGGDYTHTIEGTKQAIEQLQKYQATLDTTNTGKFKEIGDTIKQMNAELEAASRKFAEDVMVNPFSFSTEEIEEAIKITEKLQAATRDTDQYNEYARQIAEARRAQKEFVDGAKFDAMSEQLKLLPDLSDKALQEQQKYWQAMIDGASKTDTALTTYRENLEKTRDEERKRLQDSLQETKTEQVANDGNVKKSVGDIKELIKDYERLESLTDATDATGLKEIRDVIANLRQQLKQTESGFLSFEDAMAKAGTIAGGGFDGTLEDLAKIKKAIEEGMNTKLNLSDPNDIDRLKEAQKLLEDIAKEQREAAQARLEEQAKATQDAIKNGSYKGTIEETEKAIELQKQYMKLLDDTDASGIKTVEETIEALQNRLKRAKDELMDYNTAMKQVEQIQRGTWKGTLEDLDKIKKSLEYHKKNNLKLGDEDSRKNLKEIEKALHDVDKAAKGANMSMGDIDALLKRLDTASVEELEIAAKNLQEQLHDATRGVEDYAKTAAKLREVNQELKKAKKEWEGQENVIVKTTKRLMAYVAVYGGFNEILGKMKEIISHNLQLSDSMADVQKTTGLTGIELQELGRELERIDTRTATTELYQLAAAAGQIGLKTQEDVLGFAKAANTISVALNELGAEGSATIAKIATLTGDVARSGTEQALLKVGSAINELTANSAATAGPIADFISRVGGIASSANIAIHEMAALGAATDASAQSIEIAGTSMNKFITALVSNTENIAYATNLNARELQTLINEGNTMQAVIRVLESMQTMDRGGISAAMKELGSEGARMNQYVASMVSNLDMLKAQLAISKEAFDENVSVINEYNVKQESAMGILQRMKNAFMDTFVNSKMTVILKNVLEMIAAIPDWLEKHRNILLGIRIVIAQILVLRIPFLLNALAKQLWGMYALLSGPMLTGLKAFRHAWRQAELELVFSGKAVNVLTISLRTLGNVIKAHPIGFVASLVTAGLVAWYHFREETDEVAKATAELTKKHTRQIEELQALRNALEATNTSYAVKAAAMREINSLYSKYLGFELSELDTYEKKKAALDYINAKLKENQTLELATRQKEVYSEDFNKDTEKSMENITEALMAIPEIGAKRLTEAMNVMNEAIKNGATTAEEVMAKLSEHFKTDVEFDDDEWGFLPNVVSYFTDTNLESLENYVEKYAILQQQLAGTDEYFNGQKIENQRISDEKLAELAVAHQNKIAAIEANHQEKLAELQKQGSAMTEAEQIAHLQSLLKEQQEYQKTAEKMLQRAREKDEEFLASQTNDEGVIDLGNMHAKYGGTETGHIVSSRVNELNSLRTEMKKIRQQIADDEIALQKATDELRLAQEKENNDAEVEAKKIAVEEKKKAINDGNEAIIRNEMKWNSKYAELQTWATSDARKKWSEAVEDIGGKIRSLQIQIAGDPWGKAFDLKDWKQFPEFIEGLEGASVASLVQGFEKLRDNTKLITQDVDAFNKMFDLKTPLKDLEEVNTQVFRWLAQIRAELKRRDRNTSGAPIFTNAKQELDAVLNNLQTHFLKRQAEIRKAYIDGAMTSEEMDRRIAENDRVFVSERIQLRKMLLGENSNFLKELYPDLAETDLGKLRLDLQRLEDGITDDLRKALEEDENLITERSIKIRKAMEKELLATDPFGTLRQNFRSGLDELLLMSSEFERQQAQILNATFAELGKNMGDKFMGLDEESQQERLDFLMELSKKSYTVDRDGLREMFKSHEEYYNWVTNLDDQQMDVMLAKLQWFYDESLIKQKAYADRLHKAQQSAYEQQGLKYDDVAKIQWEINNLKAQRNNLVTENLSPDIKPNQYKTNEDAIIAHTQLINRLEAELLEAQKKAADKSKSFRSKQEREAKEQMEASISALQAYYNEMEAMIRKQGLENNWTPEDIERKVLANRITAERDEIELRKKLLGDASTFDPNANNGYRGVITGTEFFGSKKGEAQLKKQAEQIQIWGKALIDGMRNQIAKGEIEIATDLQKVQDKIKDALLEGDMFGKFENDFASMLDELGVLTTDFEDQMDAWQLEVKNRTGIDFGLSLSEEERAKRIGELTRFADEAYTLTAESLRERMAQNTMYANWVNNLNDDEMNVLLQKLRTYYDDRIELTKKYQDKMKKEFEAMYQQTGQQAEYEQRKNDISQRTQQQSDLEGYGITRGVDYDAKRQGVADNWKNEDQRYQDQIDDFQKKRDALVNDMAKTMREKGLGSEEYQEMYRQKEAMDQLILDTELERNNLLAQSQRDLTQVYMDEWTKRAERWGQWGEMFGEYLGEQVMLEKQANDARARGDLETAKKIEQQQKQNKQALIQNLLNKIVDEAALWAKEYALKMMFNSLMLAEDKKKAIEEMTLEGKKSTLSILLSALTGQASEHKKGLSGLVTGAIIFAATMALQAFAKSAIANMFPEAASGSTTNRKLSTGMLTYESGYYPDEYYSVNGRDGKTYRAKYEGSNIKTGIYGGGAHFGIFSEKQPEMIVDGKTTQKLILNYPYIYDAITTIAKNGRLVNAMPTFASGDYPAGMRQIAQVEAVDMSGGASEDMIQMRATMEETREVNRQLLKLLQGGITAHVDGLENYKQQKKNERFLKRRGID